MGDGYHSNIIYREMTYKNHGMGIKVSWTFINHHGILVLFWDFHGMSYGIVCEDIIGYKTWVSLKIRFLNGGIKWCKPTILMITFYDKMGYDGRTRHAGSDVWVCLCWNKTIGDGHPTMRILMAMVIHMNLGKLSYFTDLNLVAIWGWFPES